LRRCKEKKCNITAYYEWGAMLFGDETLASVPEPGQRIPETQVQWWDIDKFDNVETGGYSLTNEHGMEVMATKCRQYMQAIQLGLSGRHGPVSEQAVYEVMCMSFCTVNDQMRKDAMEYSCCSCMELSTQPDEVGFSRPGDWCREESGRMMCEELERCGTWECELDDYSCPRMEYNTLTIDLKGKADIFGCAGVGGMFVALRQLGVGAAIVAAVAGMLAFN
jgi:hypothetical protein